MNFIEFIQTRSFLRHFVLSVILTVAIIAFVLSMLKWYTHHGESVTVPSLVGLSPDQIGQLETIDNFEVIIVDSVFDSRQPKGTVIIQDPQPGSKVKRHRKIYLTTVALLPEQVGMPGLVDLTLRQASATLETYDLILGNVSYVPDIAANAVLAQFHNGREIAPGTPILKGSVISLRVGQSMGNGRIQIPFLLGKTRDEAIRILEINYFTPGQEVFEDNADPETARVYSQSPSFARGLMLNAGQTINLVFKDPSVFDFESYLESLGADTLDIQYDTLN